MHSFSRLVALQLGVAVLALLPAFASAQSSADSTTALGPQALRAAIAASTFTTMGKQYPAFGGASCRPGDMKPFGPVAYINLASGNHQKQNVATPPGVPRTARYSPPNADWLIQFYDRHVDAASGTFLALDTAFPPNYSFTNLNYSLVSSNMQSFVASLGLNDQLVALLNSQIQTYLLNYEAYSNSISNASGAVRVMAQVWGTGTFNVNPGHSSYTGWIIGSLVCAPAYLHDQAALEARLKQWVHRVLIRSQIPANTMKSTPSPLPA